MRRSFRQETHLILISCWKLFCFRLKFWYLKANPNRIADGTVIEAKMEKGRGSVATVLVQRGTLKVGDICIAGKEWGHVRAMFNEMGHKVL